MSQTGATILVVDDDPDFLAQARLHLEQDGYAVRTAESEAAAEDVLRQARPDLVVLDLMMDHADSGFRLAHRIKQADAATPVILITSVTRETGLDFSTPGNGSRGWMKVDLVLDKPIRPEQLRRETQRLLSVVHQDRARQAAAASPSDEPAREHRRPGAGGEA